MNKIKRHPGIRIVTVCELCIQLAKSLEDPLHKNLTETLTMLNSVTIVESVTVSLLESMLLKIAAILRQSFSKECWIESRSVKTLETIKKESSCIEFLCHKNRNNVIINTLLSLAGQDNISEVIELRKLPQKKIRNLCLAYESLMGLSNSNLTTAPSVLQNIRLLKATHSRDVVRVCGYPTGGSYTMLQTLATSPLPVLSPPQCGDFASADDNLQVIISAHENPVTHSLLT